MLGLSAYPTFQVFLAVFVTMAVTMVLLPIFIRIMRFRQIGQQIRADGPERHLIKQGTPTMGGVIILLAILISMLLLARPDGGHDFISVSLVTGATILTGVLGIIDDVSKVIKQRSLGVTPPVKLVVQTIISIAFCLGAVNLYGIAPTVEIPFVATIDLGVLTTIIPISETATLSIPWLYLVFIVLLMAGFSNAVNLTDGLDGLAGGCIMLAMLAMAAIAYRGDDLGVALFCGAAAGACIGFLWFNGNPASIFMGDTGSLALGTAFAAIAVLTKTEVVSIVIGGLFVFEALSVMIQVSYFKLTGKRVFLMAPFHHHLEKKGWSETKVVIRLWIVTGFLACIGFAWFFAQAV